VEAHRHSWSIARADNLEAIERRCAGLGWLGRRRWLALLLRAAPVFP
jgi:hypothetical protein